MWRLFDRAAQMIRDGFLLGQYLEQETGAITAAESMNAINGVGEDVIVTHRGISRAYHLCTK